MAERLCQLKKKGLANAIANIVNPDNVTIFTKPTSGSNKTLAIDLTGYSTAIIVTHDTTVESTVFMIDLNTNNYYRYANSNNGQGDAYQPTVQSISNHIVTLLWATSSSAQYSCIVAKYK